MEILDFNKRDTWNEDVLDFLYEKGKSRLPWSDYWGFREELLDSFEDEIFGLLEDNLFRAWHFTRILNPEAILEIGLKPLTLELYEDEILPTILGLFDVAEQELIKEVHLGEMQGKQWSNRKNQIWFSCDNKFLMGEGVERFWKTFGGEYSMVLMNMSGINNGLEKIKNLGFPVAFELEIPFSKVNSTCRSQIMKEFIDDLFNPQYYKEFTANRPEGFIMEKIIPIKSTNLF